MNRKNDDGPMQRDQRDKIAEFRPQDGGSGSERPNGQLRQKLPPEVHAFLGHRLRAAYSDLVNEPVPPALLDLLNRLKAQELDARANGDAVQEPNEAKEKA